MNAANKKLTTYTIRRYTTGDEMDQITLTDEQFKEYMTVAQQPEGICKINELPECFSRFAAFLPYAQDVTVYLD